jgi:hypothetical protein
MRAKFVNEIKKGRSGWSTIGVGHDAMTPGWFLIKKRWPEFVDSFTSWDKFISGNDVPIDIFEKYLKKSGTSKEETVWAEHEELLLSMSDNKNWADSPIQHTQDFTEIFFQGNVVQSQKENGWVLYFKHELKIGALCQEIDEENEVSTYFFIVV